MHLKDVRAAGAHDTCAFGEGIVGIEDCVAAMAEIGFTGPVSIEHEPEHHDPLPEVLASKVKLERWMAAHLATG